MGFYDEDLAHVHHAGFTGLAATADPWIVQLLRGAGVQGGPVVDVGCGSGECARILGEAGHDVLGVDCSEAMIALAGREAPAAALRLGSWVDLELEPCAAVIAVGEVLTYIDGERFAPGHRVYVARAPR